MSTFYDQLSTLWQEGRFLCVGLDPQENDLPKHLLRKFDYNLAITTLAFNQCIIDATKDYVCAFKPNLTFYEHSPQFENVLLLTIEYIHQVAPEIPVILDSSSYGSTIAAFDRYDADAITIHPYLGLNANRWFLDRQDKGIIVLVKASSLHSREFQDLLLANDLRLYQQVADNVAFHWNYNQNVAVAVSANSRRGLVKVRALIGDMPILIPDIDDARGISLGSTVRAGINSRRDGIIINSSRRIIYASSDEDFAEYAGWEAKTLNSDINAAIRAAI